ncbi:MAG: leucine--tRNA ligase, partial [Gammaproteobacteria bacterium]|nr:leucine--tRNA ligase [Gammaproteobacteria bacterium]
DVNGRFHRLLGKDVFEPIGFDAFGIHSENFALKNNTNPNELIPSNIRNFTSQLKRMGGMFDWDHTVDTTSKEYYRWTQWLFLQLYHAGLVERREAPVNWCPSCMTVVANEQVNQGLCERCDSGVELRNLQQWFFRITEYAEKLLDDIKDLDWSNTTRIAQTNWIGRSEGAEVLFPVLDANTNIKVFTTRPDTLFGATYMVLAPEHPMVAELIVDEHSESVESYIAEAQKINLVDRKIEDREKTGVWTGSYCVNPMTGQNIPIWISDYVLIEYGTGAIMAVPAHDQRDFEFATKFELPIREVISQDGVASTEPLSQAYADDGILINSGEFCGQPVEVAKQSIVQHLEQQELAKPVVNYRLHDWCISRQRYWGPPIPIIYCDSCGVVPVPEEDLPVELPYLENFRPDDSGESPLSRDRSWFEVKCPKCSNNAHRETDVSDTFLDSSWYFLRYPCTDDDTSAFSHDLMSKWLPVDSYIGGNEHAVLHLLYSRFVTMALKDLGYLEFDEPFTKFRAHGLLIKDGAKISKSRGNVINPDEVIQKFGADTVRTYLMFLGPFNQNGNFLDKGIQGPAGFLRRVWQSVTTAIDGEVGDEIVTKLHQTIKSVTEDLHQLRFNTAIASLMEYLNVVRADQRTIHFEEVKPLVIMLAPFAPHLCEELWEHLGSQESIFESSVWPEYDEDKIKVDEVEIGVQINGKVRGSIAIPVVANEQEVLNIASEHENVAAYLEGAEIRKTIYIPGRALNIVIAK